MHAVYARFGCTDIANKGFLKNSRVLVLILTRFYKEKKEDNSENPSFGGENY